MKHDFDNARRGAVLSSTGKTRVTMYLDDDIIQHFRDVATRNGRGYQTEINSSLRAFIDQKENAEVLAAFGVAPIGRFMEVKSLEMLDRDRLTFLSGKLQDAARSIQEAVEQGYARPATRGYHSMAFADAAPLSADVRVHTRESVTKRPSKKA